jgi:hypothetical protein
MGENVEPAVLEQSGRVMGATAGPVERRRLRITLLSLAAAILLLGAATAGVFGYLTIGRGMLLRGADLAKELLVRRGRLVEQQLKRVLAVQRGERAAQADDGGMLGGVHQQVLAAGAGG